MLQVIKFILKCIANFVSMLFTIDIGDMSLGTLMCIIFIFLPVLLSVVTFLKYRMKGD